MAKVYHFERETRENVLAESEDAARVRLTELGYIEDEFELIDVTEDVK